VRIVARALPKRCPDSPLTGRRLPGSAAVGSAIYQLDVSPDGHYVADGDGPQEVNGFFQIHTSTGDIPNPLWQFNGTVDLLTAPSHS
jgi:ABC-2 type transport system permease protein